MTLSIPIQLNRQSLDKATDPLQNELTILEF